MIHLVAQGVRDKQWALHDEKDADSPLIQDYLHEAVEQINPVEKPQIKLY